MGAKLLLFFLTCSLIFTFVMVFYPPLSLAKFDSSELIKETRSPDERYKLSVYFRGGVLFKWDYSYIGVLEDLKTGESENLLWLPPEPFQIEWKDNNTLKVNELILTVPGNTYDAR